MVSGKVQTHVGIRLFHQVWTLAHLIYKADFKQHSALESCEEFLYTAWHSPAVKI